MVPKELAKEMERQNSHSHFVYRQFFRTPAPLPPTLSLAGQTAIVTGSNTGLGYHASLQLLQRDLSHLILAVRSSSKGEAAKARLLASLPTSLKNLQWSIVAFAQRVKAFPGYIDMIILNAGAVNSEYNRIEETWNESTVQTNWLSNALLTILLRPILQSKYEARGTAQKPPVLSIVGSETAGWAAFKEGQAPGSVLEKLNDHRGYNGRDRYYTSKLLLLLFFREYCSRLAVPGSSASKAKSDILKNDVVINNVNPGVCFGTDLHRSVEGVGGRILAILKRILGRRTDVSARCLAHGAAVAGVESYGKYLSDEEVTVFVPFVESDEGKSIQKKVWKEMVAELGKAVDFEKVMRDGL